MWHFSCYYLCLNVILFLLNCEINHRDVWYYSSLRVILFILKFDIVFAPLDIVHVWLWYTYLSDIIHLDYDTAQWFWDTVVYIVILFSTSYFTIRLTIWEKYCRLILFPADILNLLLCDTTWYPSSRLWLQKSLFAVFGGTAVMGILFIK